MIVITTRYLGPTNTKGARIRVRNECTGQTKIASWNDAADPTDNHDQAACRAVGDWYSQPNTFIKPIGSKFLINDDRLHIFEASDHP